MFLTIVPHEILVWSVTRETTTVFGDVTFTMTKYGSDGFTITLFVVRDKILPIPFLLIGYDFGKLIYLKLMIFWRVGIVESPLPERHIPAEQAEKHTILLI